MDEKLKYCAGIYPETGLAMCKAEQSKKAMGKGKQPIVVLFCIIDKNLESLWTEIHNFSPIYPDY